MQRHQDAILRGDYQAVVFLLTDVYAEVNRSDTSFLPPGNSSTVFLNGVLTVVEKGAGVFIEWNPTEYKTNSLSQSEDGTITSDDSWVIEGSPPKPATETFQSPSNFAFSADLKDLRSYTYNEPSKGTTWIRFICKDGTASETLHFKDGGYRAFVDCLQRYTILSRSAKERNLVLFVDQSTEALEKSVGMLNLNKDIMSRFLSNPYATSLTALSKVTNLMTPLLDPSAVTENQLRAMSLLDTKKSDALRSHNEQGFEHIFELELPERPLIEHRDTPVSYSVWDSFRDPDGRITDVHPLKSLIFRGGIEPELRKTAWKYILGYYEWEKTDEENRKIKKQKSDSYFRMKLQWMSMTEDQEKRFSEFRDRKALIDKDVMRTDRTHPFFNREKKQHLVLLKDILMTYVMYDFDLGYVQGMSDFLSPLLVVMEDEVDTFWSFVGLMERVHENFEMEQIYKLLKSTKDDIINNIININKKIDSINTTLDESNCRINHAETLVKIYENKHLLSQNVIDDDYGVTTNETGIKEKLTLADYVSLSVKNGLNTIDKKQLCVDIHSDIDNTVYKVFEDINPYLAVDLPPLIGTDDFYTGDFAHPSKPTTQHVDDVVVHIPKTPIQINTEPTKIEVASKSNIPPSPLNAPSPRSRSPDIFSQGDIERQKPVEDSTSLSSEKAHHPIEVKEVISEAVKTTKPTTSIDFNEIICLSLTTHLC